MNLRDTRSFKTAGKIIFGVGAVEGAGDELKAMGVKKVCVATDPGIEKAGILDILRRSIEKSGLSAAYFTEVEAEPNAEIVGKAVEVARSEGCDAMVGLGGGSSMDIAKATAVVLACGGRIEDYFGVNVVPKPILPVMLIPTTAGTGSEVTSIAVLSDTVNKTKKGVVSDYMYAKVALLDPMLTVGLPPKVTASTGLDALIHAIESYTGVQSSFITETLAIEAIRLIAGNLRQAYANGDNLEARTAMMKGSLLAGMAFSNTQTAAAHAAALALGGIYHLPHGVATTLFLPAVMEFNMLACPEKFARIAEAFGEDTYGLSPMEAAELSVKAVKRLVADVGFEMGLRNYGVKEDELPMMAKNAMGAKRLLDNNPRKITEEQMEEIFRRSY